MKTFLRSLIIYPILLLTLSISGCKKEGPPGKDGSANVTSRTFQVTNWSWSSPYWYAQFNVPELTTDNLQEAAVLTYFSTNGGSAWFAVPYTQYDSPYNYYMGFVTAANLVEVNWFYDSSLSSGSDPNQYYGVSVKYKIVVIPPTERLANPDLDLTNYEQVKLRFHLAD